MDKIIYTYALIKSLYDQGEDFIDCFWPFVVKALSTDKSIELVSVQENLNNQYNLQMPLHVLGTVIDRAKRIGYIEQKEKLYGLTEKGLKYSDTLETDKDVERRINALIEDIKLFLNKFNFDVSADQILRMLLCFVHKNIEPLIEFINPSVTPNESLLAKIQGKEKILIDYIITAEQQKPGNYKTFQDMVCSYLLCRSF